MWFRTLPLLACVGAFSLLAACGGSDGAADDDDDDGASSSSSGGNSSGGSSGGSSSGGNAALTCSSLALCTTYEVKTFLGQVPAPAGGALRDGIYRLDYIVSGASDDSFAGYKTGVEALLVQGSSYVWAGFSADERGTLTASGSTLTFADRTACPRGDTGDAFSGTDEFAYTTDGETLSMFHDVTVSNGDKYVDQYVFKRVSSPGDVCETVDSEPSSPGSSATCNVRNCGCVIKANQGPIDPDTCPA